MANKYRYTTCGGASADSNTANWRWLNQTQLVNVNAALRVQVSNEQLSEGMTADELLSFVSPIVKDFNPVFVYRNAQGRMCEVPNEYVANTLTETVNRMRENNWVLAEKGWERPAADGTPATPDRTENGFRGRYAFLSNMYTAPVTLDFYGTQRTFLCAEAAYQAFKSPTDVCRFEKLDGLTAKKTGRQITIRPDWDQIKLGVMEYVLEAKFRNPALRTALMNTKNTVLEERNNWKDNYWGIWDAAPEYGQNWLGKLLMKLRDGLRLPEQAA